MPAYFETGFFTNGKPAWHGLGTVIQGQVTSTQEGIKLAGLDWQIYKLPAQSTWVDGTAVEAPGSFNLYRSTDKAYLGTVGRQYEIVQNEEAFNWFDPFLHEGDVYLETAGSLKGGKVIWILARLNDSTREVVPGDPVEQRLLLSNTHSGEGSLTGAFVNTRVVCANTLAIAHNEALRSGNFLNLRHTKNIHFKLSEIQAKVNLARRNFEDSVDLYQELARHQMTTLQFRASLEALFAKELATKDVEGEERTLDTYRPSQKILRNFESTPDLQATGVRGTRWAAYNAVTQYFSHQSRSNSEDSRASSLWYGSSKEQIRKAQDLLLTV
ncbi:DUF932 domain-containing protein [Leptolyngbya sp. AN03gr2]|uniref:DUF932 domain-containing protein n=1 Tax=Leptolyngbya sp. AN03gr2 TaxID=3423364 RepID=UPI003D31EC81